MDDGPEGRLKHLLNKFFGGRNDLPLEELILAARQDGEVPAEDAAMLIKVLRLGHKQVADIMIPRTDIACAEENDTIQEVCQLIIENGYSRIPICRHNRDHMVGVIHAKDLLRYLLEPDQSETPLSAVMRDLLFVPESKNLKEMFREFQNRRIHIAIALDEYGGTSGLVTFEDVLEEIVGEIEDEHDPTKPQDYQEFEDGILEVSGRFPLEDLEERFGIALESDEVETVGGYLSQLAGRVPRQGESFSLAGKIFTVTQADRRQVRWVRIEPQPEPEPTPTE
ncbi:hemolysin family protein [Fundidesulfovibrio butyratiphilus]